MAMLVNPECQRLAQEEIDRVVGKERLPTFEDRPSLPYIECVVREILRYVKPSRCLNMISNGFLGGILFSL